MKCTRRDHRSLRSCGYCVRNDCPDYDDAHHHCAPFACCMNCVNRETRHTRHELTWIAWIWPSTTINESNLDSMLLKCSPSNALRVYRSHAGVPIFANNSCQIFCIIIITAILDHNLLSRNMKISHRITFGLRHRWTILILCWAWAS